jgi:hypothetical protein
MSGIRARTGVPDTDLFTEAVGGRLTCVPARRVKAARAVGTRGLGVAEGGAVTGAGRPACRHEAALSLATVSVGGAPWAALLEDADRVAWAVGVEYALEALVAGPQERILVESEYRAASAQP